MTAPLPNLGTSPAASSEARNGTPTALPTPAEALAAHEGLLHTLARRSGAARLSPEDRADMLQDMRLDFARAWAAADPSRSPKEILSWAALHARRAAWSWYRARNAACRSAEVCSLDIPLPGGDSLMDLLPAPTPPGPMLADDMADAVRTLSGRDHAVITRHYFGGELFSHIAETWGLSRVRVHQIHTQALAKLRRYFSTTDAHR